MQDSAKYESEIQAAMFRMNSADTQEEESECDEPNWMSDDDPDEFWQKLQDAGPQEDADVSSTPPSQKPALTELEATAELLKFRPLKSRPADLERLLSYRANPNAPIQSDDITPLRKVILFASEKDVVAMRELLLKHGANQSEDDLKRWATRQRCDLFEHSRVKAFYEDPRDFNPWTCSSEMGL